MFASRFPGKKQLEVSMKTFKISTCNESITVTEKEVAQLEKEQPGRVKYISSDSSQFSEAIEQGFFVVEEVPNA